METLVMEVTPEQAVEWLCLNSNNRKVSNRDLSKYVRDMKTGAWKLNGESIKIGNNRLLDGQHRLMACIEAEVPFKTFVTLGLDNEVFDTIDTGKTRNIADVFTINGVSNVTNLTALLRLINSYKTALSDKSSSFETFYRLKMTINEYEKFYSSDTELFNKAASYGGSNRFPGISPAVVSGLYYLTTKVNPVESEVFMQSLMTGAGLQNANPILTYRNKLINDFQKKNNIRTLDKFILGIRVWNLWRSGKEAKRVNYLPSGTLVIPQ